MLLIFISFYLNLSSTSKITLNRCLIYSFDTEACINDIIDRTLASSTVCHGFHPWPGKKGNKKEFIAVRLITWQLAARTDT